MAVIVKRAIFALATLLVVLWIVPSPEPQPPVREDRLALGTLVTVKLYGDDEAMTSLFPLAFAQFDLADSLMSRYRDDSEVAAIERAGGRSVVPSPAVHHVLERSIHWARACEGAFDPTVGALTRLWNFPDATAVPDSASVDSALALVDYRALVVNEHGVHLARADVRLDLGAAAKGYAVDQAVEALRSGGAQSGLIEAGGDIRYWGEKPDGHLWRFGIQHPRDPNRYFEVEDIGLSAIATSGDYQQYFLKDTQRYHHIIDPQSGWPARRLISATIWAETAMDADILSTAVFVLGAKRGLELVEQWPRVEALIFTDTAGGLKSQATSGVQGRFRFVD